MKILGYGSLMDQQSLNRLLGRKTKLERVVVNGYARVFNVPFYGYSFLNLSVQPNSLLEAVSFEIDGSELVNFARREAGSDLVEITPGLWAFVWPKTAVKELDVLQSYIDFCEDAATKAGIDIRKGFTKPAVIVNDRHEPKYPDMGQ